MSKYFAFQIKARRSIVCKNNYFKNTNDIENSNLSIPISIPINFRWKSNGVYGDHFSELDKDFLDASYVSNNKIDVIMLDINLKSNKSGLELAEAIRKINKNSYIIFMKITN